MNRFYYSTRRSEMKEKVTAAIEEFFAFLAIATIIGITWQICAAIMEVLG